MTPLWIIGSGGHAAVVIDAARASGHFDIMGCLDDDPARCDTHVLGVPVLGSTSLEDLARLGVTNAIIAIGSNVIRRRIADLVAARLEWKTMVHPRAYIGENCQVGAGTVVMAGAIVQPNTSMGEHVIINTAASVDHDGHIGAHAHIGPGCHLAGNVSVGQGTQLGIGVVAIPGVTIGEWSIIGAGAVVTRDIPANVTAVGTPARVIKGWEPDSRR